MVVVFNCPTVFAWGSKGHHIIADVARQQLTPGASAEIARLLTNEDFVSASTWADDMRTSQDNPAFWSHYASAWHFVNLAPGKDYEASEKSRYGDAVQALISFTAILQDKPVPAGPVLSGLQLYFGNSDMHSTAVKQFALKFLVHIIADLHQPLHCGYAHDHGGNDTKMSWLGKATSLHAVWDTLLLDQAHLSESKYRKRIDSRLRQLPSKDLHDMQTADVSQWLDECSSLLLRIHNHNGSNGVIKDEAEYASEFVPLVDNQLLKAAVRTAWWLNSVYGGMQFTNQGKSG